MIIREVKVIKMSQTSVGKSSGKFVWRKLVDDCGNREYYNRIGTREVSWTLPPGAILADNPVAHYRPTDWNRDDEDEASEASESTAVSEKPMQHSDEVAPPKNFAVTLLDDWYGERSKIRKGSSAYWNYVKDLKDGTEANPYMLPPDNYTHICLYPVKQADDTKGKCRILLKQPRKESKGNQSMKSWSTTRLSDHFKEHHPDSSLGQQAILKAKLKQEKVQSTMEQYHKEVKVLWIDGKPGAKRKSEKNQIVGPLSKVTNYFNNVMLRY